MGRLIFQEADFYGASNLAFGVAAKPNCFKATWMHGLGPVFFRENTDPKVLINYDEQNLPLHLVNNYETQKLLESHGFNSQAVGMPILYTKHYDGNMPRDISRLYMPAHILGNLRVLDRIPRWQAMIKKYGCDAICLSEGDYQYVMKNKVHLSGALVLQGAHPKNRNSLENIASYFKRTDELITDSSGSHIPYATAMGVNVPVIEELKFSKESKQNVLKTIPKKLSASFAQHMERNPLSDVVRLWGSADDQAKLDYSRHILGERFVCTKVVLRELLTPQSFLQEASILASLYAKKIRRKLENQR